MLFPKSERLCSTIAIETLFRTGQKKKRGDFLLTYLLCENDAVEPAKFLISVPKRNLRKAVSRNRVKRLIREIYRTSKHVLPPSIKWLAIRYKGTVVPDYTLCKTSLLTLFSEI